MDYEHWYSVRFNSLCQRYNKHLPQAYKNEYLIEMKDDCIKTATEYFGGHTKINMSDSLALATIMLIKAMCYFEVHIPSFSEEILGYKPSTLKRAVNRINPLIQGDLFKMDGIYWRRYE